MSIGHRVRHFGGAARVGLEDLEKEHGFKVEIHERGRDLAMFTGWRYFATAKNLEERGDGILIGISGNGNTPEDALRAFCDSIQGRRMVVNGYSDKRSEFDAPHAITWKAE